MVTGIKYSDIFTTSDKIIRKIKIFVNPVKIFIYGVNPVRNFGHNNVVAELARQKRKLSITPEADPCPTNWQAGASGGNLATTIQPLLEFLTGFLGRNLKKMITPIKGNDYGDRVISISLRDSSLKSVLKNRCNLT